MHQSLLLKCEIYKIQAECVGGKMNVFIVYCHPSKDSFTRHVRDHFLQGARDAGHTCVVSDLYRMRFQSDMTEAEYARDAHYRDCDALAPDVIAEQRKINASDAVAFIYPVFWTEAPAKLVGWFDRVWTCGFAYAPQRMKQPEKALVLCTAGNARAHLESFGLLAAMKKVMLGDRLFGRVKASEFMVLDGMTREFDSRTENWDAHLAAAYEKGKTLFDAAPDAFALDGLYLTASDEAGTFAGAVFAFRQTETAVWGDYSGGRIVKGAFIGSVGGAIGGKDTFDLHYRHLCQNCAMGFGILRVTLARASDGTLTCAGHIRDANSNAEEAVVLRER